MTFDPGPHRTPLAACPPAANYGDAAGPVRLVIDPLCNRVDLNPLTTPAEALPPGLMRLAMTASG
jgi:hypothetical protein